MDVLYGPERIFCAIIVMTCPMERDDKSLTYRRFLKWMTILNIHRGEKGDRIIIPTELNEEL